MDGTTAGRIDLGPPTPQPVPTPVGGVLHISHTAAPVQPSAPSVAPAVPVPPTPVMQTPQPPTPLPAAPIAPSPSIVPLPAQPQFSQLTPVYAPTPTNTPADIPQPSVKGLEFTKTPTPVVAAVPLPPPIPMSPPPIAPVAPMVSASPAIPPPTMPNVIPASSSPVTSLDGIAPPPVSAPTAPAPAVAQPRQDHYSQLENQLQDIDLDQMVGVVPELPASPQTYTPPVTTAPVAPIAPAAPIEPAVVSPANPSSYFQNTFQAPVKSGVSLPSFSPKNLNMALIKKIAIIAASVIIFALAGFYIVNSIITNNKAKEALAEQTVQTPVVEEPVVDVPVVDTPVVEPEPELPTTPAIPTVPSAPAVPEVEEEPVVSERVPTTANSGVNDADIAKQPKQLKISSLGIDADVERIGVTSTGAMDVPDDIWNAGWYIGSAKPGTSGAVFIDGHSTANRNGLFGYLNTIKVGAAIDIERNDGATIRYKVVRVDVVDRNDVDMAVMLQPYDPSRNGLNIMSCAGQWIEDEQTLTDRVLVYAVQM